MMNKLAWDATLTMPVAAERDHIRGAARAAVTLVEYGDYECPHCRLAHSIIRTIQIRLRGRLCFVFRHFPIATVHSHAQPAAEAAEAAANQRKFWAMHDLLYTTQSTLTHRALIGAADALGLDVPSFIGDLARHSHAQRIRADFMSGVHSGVISTPAFYINGTRYLGAVAFDPLLTALNQAKALVPTLSGR